MLWVRSRMRWFREFRVQSFERTHDSDCRDSFEAAVFLKPRRTRPSEAASVREE